MWWGLTALFVYGILRDPARRDDLPSALLNKQTPVFTLPLFDRYRTEFGTEFDAAAARGRPLIVNFWASWCLPCREEMPVLEASWREYRDSVLFVGINTQERSEEDAQALMNEFGLTYPNGVDQSNRINIDFGLFGAARDLLHPRRRDAAIPPLGSRDSGGDGRAGAGATERLIKKILSRF